MNIVKLNSVIQSRYNNINNNHQHRNGILSKPVRYSQRKYVLCHSDKNDTCKHTDNESDIISQDKISHYCHKKHNSDKISHDSELMLKDSDKISLDNDKMSPDSDKKHVVIRNNYGLFISSTLILSSILFLSTSIVLILSAREMNVEAERLQDKYTKIQEDIKHLEEKNIQDERIINAIVGKMIELRSIGII